MTDSTQDMLAELRQRVVRIESRICRLGDHIGANLSDTVKQVRIADIDDTEVAVYLPALDIALSALLNLLKEKGKAGKIATVWFDSRQVAQFYIQ